MKRKSILLSVALALMMTSNAFADNEFTARWPVINDNKVNGRDFPDAKLGSVKFQLQSGTRVSVRYKTKEIDTINGKAFCWYQVSPQDGEYKNQACWVFGQFLSFKKGFEETYWQGSMFKIEPIDKRVVYKNILVKRIVSSVFGNADKDGRYAFDKLEEFRETSSSPTRLWYMKENYPEAVTYKTAFGEMMAFVGREKRLWNLVYLQIEVAGDYFGISPGMKVEEIEKVLGKGYKMVKGRLVFDQNEDFDSYFLSADVEGDQIKSILIELMYT